MTTINFPSGPTIGQVYTFGGRAWEWNGVGWVATPGATLTSLIPNSQTGTTYTLALTDAGKCVYMNNAAANALTIPPNSTVALPVDTRIFVLQEGVGATTIAAGAGVTISTADGLKVGGQHKMISLVKRGTDAWISIGTTA